MVASLPKEILECVTLMLEPDTVGSLRTITDYVYLPFRSSVLDSLQFKLLFWPQLPSVVAYILIHEEP